MTAQSNITPESIVGDLRYLQLLSRSFPTIADASTEIINLEAILNLPKGTEHFLTDKHGEYEAFQHVLKNASGAVKRKVNEIYKDTKGSRAQSEGDRSGRAERRVCCIYRTQWFREVFSGI